MRDRGLNRREAGLTLFETLLATAVVGTVFLGLLAAMGGSFVATGASYASTRSQNLAKRVMEEVLENAFDNLLSLDGTTVQENGYTAVVSVTEPATNLRLVEVIVTKPGAHTANTRLLTYRARR